MRKSEICKNLEAALKRLALEDFIHWLKTWNTLKYASFYSRKKRIKNYHSIKIPQKSPDIVTNVFTGHLAMNQNNTVTPQYHIYSIQSRTFTEVYFLQYLQTIQFNLSRFLTLSLKTLQAVKPACQKWYNLCAETKHTQRLVLIWYFQSLLTVLCFVYTACPYHRFNTLRMYIFIYKDKLQKTQSKQHTKETNTPSLKLFHGFNALFTSGWITSPKT